MKVKREEKEQDVWCPYCDDELVNSQLPYCQPCKLTVFHCPGCGKVVPRRKKICPECGAKMKPENT